MRGKNKMRLYKTLAAAGEQKSLFETILLDIFGKRREVLLFETY